MPKVEKCVAVSLTIRPVTHVALVAVNIVSARLIGSPVEVALGRLKRTAPNIMVIRKLNIIICGGLSFYIAAPF